MFGENGRDTLTGGLGADFLSGGSAGGDDPDNADTFVFNSFAENGIGDGNRDTISDFESGLDLIDLSGFAETPETHVIIVFIDPFGSGGETRVYYYGTGPTDEHEPLPATGPPIIDPGRLGTPDIVFEVTDFGDGDFFLTAEDQDFEVLIDSGFGLGFDDFIFAT